MMNRRGFEFSFGWIFAILVGAVILIIALYATIKFVGQEQTISNAEVAKQIGNLLSPLETNLEESKISRIGMPVETRIYNLCDNSGVFGTQKIGVGTKSGIGEEWQDDRVESSFHNKYMFSKNIVQGEDFVILSKKFDYPFKIADLIILWSANDQYCFVNPSDEISKEFSNFAKENVYFNQTIKINKQLQQCANNSIKVCFSGSGCDIQVNTGSKTVSKGRDTVYYEGELVYAAIFADPRIYECQVKRITGRASELALIYLEKTKMLSSKGCPSNLEGELTLYAQKANIRNSLDLYSLGAIGEEIDKKNDAKTGCSLY